MLTWHSLAVLGVTGNVLLPCCAFNRLLSLRKSSAGRRKSGSVRPVRRTGAKLKR
jgi:hypothetical protein